MADMILLPLLTIGACFLLHNMQGFSVLTLKVSILGPSEAMMPPKSEAAHLTQLKSIRNLYDSICELQQAHILVTFISSDIKLYYTLLYIIIHYYTLLYIIIHYYTNLYYLYNINM